MTAGEKENHKEAVKKVMVDHLTTLGYPQIGNEQVMSELKNMWVKIEEAGLVTNGMTFAAFQAYANDAFLKAHIEEMFGI